MAISFAAVATLVVVANLLVEGRVSILHSGEIYRPPPVVKVLPPPPPVVQAAPAPEPEVQRPAFPSPEFLLRAIDRLDHSVNSAPEADDSVAASRYAKLAGELEHAAADFAAGAAATDAPLPKRFNSSLRSYRQRGADLLLLGSARRSSMSQYSQHFEELNTRVKKSLDHAWSIFGRVVARQSLVKLTGNLDDLRRRYTDFVNSGEVDSSTFEALGASEAALAQTLASDRNGFTRADGQDWFVKSQADLEAMATARKALLQSDRDRADLARKFSDDGAELSQIATGAAHRAAAASLAPARATHLTAKSSGPSAHEAVAPAPEKPAPTVSSELAPVTPAFAPPVVSAEEQALRAAAEQHVHQRKVLVAWLSIGVLVLVIYISAGTVLSIVRPVRRLLRATARIAKGETSVTVPRGGIRELDTLAQAFNSMAAQLTVAQAESRDHQQLLEAKVAERTVQLRELAQLDPLTRLANRRHFFTLLNAAIDRAAEQQRRVGVFFLDIDNFKNMNDSLGHEFGDHVLQTIAQRLTTCAKPFGFAARLGGDEFTVVYASAGSAEEIQLAGLQLIEAFADPMPLNDRDLVVSVSAGASIYPDHATNAEALLRASDAALYEAKALGRSQLALFTPALLEAAMARFDIEQGLRRALDRGEFELMFQPEVNLQTCEVDLVEALIRWRLPDGRVMSPGEFLPVAEASGLIFRLTDWILRRVVETAARWHHGAWPDVRVAINVSSRQLFDNSFVEQVQALLEEFRLPARCIEIELTENVLQTGSATIAALRRLRAHGIAIALDDFGTGFSSISSLEQLPLTRIKLDRSLVASIDTSARSASIAKAIIQLCQGLGLSITAEGIERPEQLMPLLGVPALYVQGYLLSRPQTVDELLPVIAGLPAHTRSLIRDTLPKLSEPLLAQSLPMLMSAVNR